MIEVPTTVQFVAAGWHPSRTVRPSPTLPADHPATAILTNFGGLRVGTTGLGEGCATSDVAFQQLLMEDATRKVWTALLRTELIGIDEVHNKHGALYIDRAGRCYQSSGIHDAFSFEGASFNEAIEGLLLGRRSRPMLRPDQPAIRWYGDGIRADDPKVYQWR